MAVTNTAKSIIIIEPSHNHDYNIEFLDVILGYNLYYFLIYFFKWKFFRFEIYTDSYILCLIFIK